MMKRKLRLVPDWKKCHKWLSIQISFAGIVSAGLWVFIPDLQKSLPPEMTGKILLILFILIFAGRMIDQNKDL